MAAIAALLASKVLASKAQEKGGTKGALLGALASYIGGGGGSGGTPPVAAGQEAAANQAVQKAVPAPTPTPTPAPALAAPATPQVRMGGPAMAGPGQFLRNLSSPAMPQPQMTAPATPAMSAAPPQWQPAPPRPSQPSAMGPAPLPSPTAARTFAPSGPAKLPASMQPAPGGYFASGLRGEPPAGYIPASGPYAGKNIFIGDKSFGPQDAAFFGADPNQQLPASPRPEVEASQSAQMKAILESDAWKKMMAEFAAEQKKDKK